MILKLVDQSTGKVVGGLPGLRGYRSGLIKVSDGPPPLYRWQDEKGSLWGDARPYTEMFADSAALASADAAPAAVAAYVEGKEPTIIADPDDPENKARIKIGDATGPPFVASRNTVEALTNSGNTGRDVVKADTSSAVRDVSGIPSAMAIIDRTTPRALPEVFSAFAGKQDGAAPTVFDSGQAVLGSTGPGTNSQAIVLNGSLTSQPTNHGPAAFYFLGQCAGPVTRIGARFKMHVNELDPGATTYNGSATLAILLTNDWSDGPPPMSVHYVIKRDSWAIGPRESPENGGTFDVLGAQNFYPQLKLDGTTEYEVECWIDGDTLTYTTPDGGRFTATDSRFTSYTGAYFFFESQAPIADTDNRVSFTHIWASSGPQKVPAAEKPTWMYGKKATSASTVTTTTAYTAYDVPGIGAADENDFVIAPPSGRILVRFDCWVIRPTAADLIAGVQWAGGNTANLVGHSTEGAVQNRIYCTSIVQGLTPGQLFSCTPVLFSSATNSQIYVDPANNYGAHITMEPL